MLQISNNHCKSNPTTKIETKRDSDAVFTCRKKGPINIKSPVTRLMRVGRFDFGPIKPTHHLKLNLSILHFLSFHKSSATKTCHEVTRITSYEGVTNNEIHKTYHEFEMIKE